MEEREIMQKVQKSDVYDRPSALTDVLRLCLAKLKPRVTHVWRGCI